MIVKLQKWRKPFVLLMQRWNSNASEVLLASVFVLLLQQMVELKAWLWPFWLEKLNDADVSQLMDLLKWFLAYQCIYQMMRMMRWLGSVI